MLRRFLNWRTARVDFPDPTPDQPLIVVGDVHGRFDLLERLPVPASGTQLLFVGDYIDRGENSAAVLRALMAREDAICLMGNHDEMLLRFLDDPGGSGPRWLRYGGLQTLASFGIAQVSETSPADHLERARDALSEAMGNDLIAWLRGLPSMWQSGNVVVTHAGADPAIDIDDQESATLRWGHPAFETTPRTDGLWVAHGHTIVETPLMKNGRINMDTGAYATGRLTCARISDQGVTFETVT